MEKAKVRICDMCKDRVAKSKCVFCEKDLCDSCKADQIKLTGFSCVYGSKIEIDCCQKCAGDLGDLVLEPGPELDEIKEKLIKVLIKYLMIDSLKDKPDKKTTVSYIPTIFSNVPAVGRRYKLRSSLIKGAMKHRAQNQKSSIDNRWLARKSNKGHNY